MSSANGEQRSEKSPVAVVIAFYRADASFPETLASVLAQTFPPAEIVVVDDGSPPGTATTLDQLPASVRLVRLATNVGVNGARRAGTAATAAPLLAYLDADDRWAPDYLERMAAALEAAPQAPATFAVIAKRWPDGREQVFGDKPAELGIREAIVQTHVVPSGMVVRRAALDEVGDWRNDRWVIDDWHMTIRLIDRFGPMVFVPGAVVHYTVGNPGSVNSRDVRVLRQWWRTLRQLGPVVDKHYGRGAARRRFAKAMVDRAYRLGGVSGGMLRLCARVIGPPLESDVPVVR